MPDWDEQWRVTRKERQEDGSLRVWIAYRDGRNLVVTFQPPYDSDENVARSAEAYLREQRLQPGTRLR